MIDEPGSFSGKVSSPKPQRIAILHVIAWAIFWLYVMGRWSPLLWWQEGIPRFTLAHFFWWSVALFAGFSGGTFRVPNRGPLVTMTLGVLLVALAGGAIWKTRAGSKVPASVTPGFSVERTAPSSDGTSVYLQTFDYQKQPGFKVGLYDCDEDDAAPGDDANTSYMGQSLAPLAVKLERRAGLWHRRLLCLTNGGFFGATGFSVARHEAPIVEDHTAHYHVDLLRPKDQAWLLAINSPESVESGQPRFVMASSIPWEQLEDFQTVLGGVRPLRFNGQSVALRPGAGNTGLHCSRTSVGWSVDGSQFYLLVADDINSEASSELRKRRHWPQSGGWDVRQVQEFWEQKGVPFAVLLDGGESTQLAVRRPGGGWHELPSGYQYSFTLGYLFGRPLQVTLPILPPSEARRGVLNYVYVEGPE